ncbi:cyclic peptide export ABC transporter [Acetivibrio straminisolvens]|nr:cyclic peptide export ABC transporter [Acetivibrio straminisolvens]
MLDSGLSLTIMLASGAVTIVTLYFIGVLLWEIIKKERSFQGNGIKGFFTFLMTLAMMGIIAFCLYKAPYILFNGVSWEMIEEWGPSSLIYAVTAFSFVIPVFFVYFLLANYFVKPNDKPFFMIIVLSIVSGIGNSLVLFIVNEALNRNLEPETWNAAVESGLYVYFILGILLFTICAMIVRKRLIKITSNIVYEKRMQIIDSILKASYHKFEAIENGKIYAALNNDTETVSGFVNMFVSFFSGVITMITCFIYLGTLNFYGMVLSVLIIVLAVAMFLKISQSAEKLFDKNREIQNTFFDYISDMVMGFKELYISKKKRLEFRDDIQSKCEMYRDSRVEGEYKFVGASIIGEIMYISVIGIVVFTFPMILPSLDGNTLRNYVLVYLYMGGIVNQIIFLIPEFVRVLVSWKRINGFIEEIKSIEEEAAVTSSIEEKPTIELKEVTYQYKNENGEKFSVGPIDYTFRPGEIVFISGGNGSGKSTLAKLITGLYKPDKGEITVNRKNVDPETLGSYFTAIYSDFHLFERLYGIQCEEKREEIEKYLKILDIADKVEINDGAFSTLKLSTGQRKRLALLVSYLEDRPVYLFDEWAADQDPEFRKFFYKTLLPELKARGKTVIAITHDDSYFDEADRLIKMEMGRIVERKDDVR